VSLPNESVRLLPARLREGDPLPPLTREEEARSHRARAALAEKAARTEIERDSLQLLTSIKALPYVAIATTVVFRNVSTLLCAFIETVYFGEKFSTRAKAALVLIFLGSLVYAKEDLTFNFTGYMWLCGNTAAYTINNIYTKLTVTKMDQTGSGIALVTTLLTLPMFTLYAVHFGEIPQGIYDLGGLSTAVMVVFLFLGLMGTLISMSCEFLFVCVLFLSQAYEDTIMFLPCLHLLLTQLLLAPTRSRTNLSFR